MSGVLPRAFGEPVLAARIRSVPEDFLVEEIAAFEPHGEGEHLLLTIEKRSLNTAEAARRLAAWAGLPEMAIGYAGMKDRHAVTRQRFSVHLPKRVAPDVATLRADDFKVLEGAWHNRKLPRGALKGNRFVLTLRDVQGARDAIDARLAQVAARGLPNWFGGQRFGRDGGNVASALAMFSGRRVRRDQRSILLASARSELCNRVRSARVMDGSWDAGLEGEVWVLAGSRSVFGPEPWDPVLAERLAAFDIHPSAPLWGAGELRSQGHSAEIERSALADEHSLALREGLEQADLKQERRANRLVAEALSWQWTNDDTLVLSFSLPPGSYATAVLHELGEVGDP